MHSTFFVCFPIISHTLIMLPQSLVFSSFGLEGCFVFKSTSFTPTYPDLKFQDAQGQLLTLSRDCLQTSSIFIGSYHFLMSFHLQLHLLHSWQALVALSTLPYQTCPLPSSSGKSNTTFTLTKQRFLLANTRMNRTYG